MLRALVILLVLTSVARADDTSEGRELVKTSVAYYESVANHRNPLVRLWDLTGNAEWTNLVNSKKQFDESTKDFEDAIKENSAYQIHAKLGDLKNSATDLDRKAADYASNAKSMTWKLGGALGVIVLFGIVAVIRRRRR